MAKKVYYVICVDCSGKGHFNHNGDLEICSFCHGSGRIKTIIEQD